MLEYVVVCAITLFFETNSVATDKISYMDVKTCYDEILKLIITHNIPLPLTNRSLKELGSGIKKIFTIRKNMNYDHVH